jgi:hypothetical protein
MGDVNNRKVKFKISVMATLLEKRRLDAFFSFGISLSLQNIEVVPVIIIEAGTKE